MTTWRKSSFSSGTNGCFEFTDLGEVVGLRDSKLGDSSPVLLFTRAEMLALVQGVKAGEFDDLT